MDLYLKTKDYSVSKEEFELQYDKDSEMLITNPRPKNIERYYDENTYISHTDSSKTFIDKLYQLVKKYSLLKKVSLIDEVVQEQKTLLDIGAGTGDFLLSAKDNGWKVHGVEPNDNARKRAWEKTIKIHPDIESLPRSKYHMITLWHVLEHLPELDSQIARILFLLEDKGTVIIAVPNFKSFDAQYYKQFWAAYDVPRHLWHFSRNGIQKLFAKHGMKVIRTKPLIFDAFYVAVLSEKYKTGKNNYLRAFWIGFRSNLSAIRTQEYSSLIYILKKG